MAFLRGCFSPASCGSDSNNILEIRRGRGAVIPSKLEMPDTLTLPFIPKSASQQAFSPDASPAGSNMLLNKQARSQGISPRPGRDKGFCEHDSKDPSPFKEGRVEPEQRLSRSSEQEDSPMGTALRQARRERTFGSVAAEDGEAMPEVEEDNSPLGSKLLAIRRARAFGQEAAVRAEPDTDAFAVEESSPLGSKLLAIRRARAFGDEAAVRAKLDENNFEAEEENSPIGSKLCAIRRARAFGDVAAVRARLDGGLFEAEEENSPMGSKLCSVRRARAFGALPGAAVPSAEIPA
eukprot:symbB.v1.2.025807.t1/scaffold2530.1/size76790/3